MTYVIAHPCVDVKNGACVEVCPVDCIHTTPDDRQHYIDPDICIECEQCVLVCPVEAVFLDRELPDEWKHYTEINAAFFQRKKEAATAVPVERAMAMIQAVQAKAAEMGARVSVAIVARDGRMIASNSMEGADPASAGAAAEWAATTAGTFGVPVAERAQVLIPSGPKGSFVPTLASIKAPAGALPIMDGVYLVGAIAVSGGTDEQDQLCSRAGLAPRG